MDKKDSNNKEPSFNDPINWKSLGFFSSEDYLIYIFKKTEKITAALYLISGLLKDNEPLKWELRDRGIELLSSSFTTSSSVPGDKNAYIQSLFTAALETLSLLNVAKISNLISDMNYKILVREIDHIVGMLRDRLVQSAESAGYILSESFFRTPDLFSSGFRQGDRDMRSKINISPASNTIGSKPRLNRDEHISVQEKKSERQQTILNILKGQSNLTIKDFAKNLRGISEKTIQRELIELVNKGIVRKEGERRWSRYSLR